MAEAEEVLLDAAVRVGAATRTLWRRAGAPEQDPARQSAAAKRRIAAWLQMAFDVAPEIHAGDRPAPAGWLERLLGRPAPWRLAPRPAAWLQGRALFLPRELLEDAGAAASERLLLAALAQGRRLAAAPAHVEWTSTIERDLAFVLEAALGDFEIVERFPGLRAAVVPARRAERLARPPFTGLRPAEASVERLVRELLDAPLDRIPARLEALVGDRVAPGSPGAVRGLRRALGIARDGGGYRGVLPVAHWGRAAAPPPEWREGPLASGERTGPTRPVGQRRLRRHVARRVDADPNDARPGAPLMAPGDAHQAVQDARGLRRPPDRGDVDLDELADELERAAELPVERSAGEVREVLESEGPGAPQRWIHVAGPADRSARTFRYPEWDDRISAYRDPGVVLREQVVPGGDLDWVRAVEREHAAVFERVRRHFDALRPRREWQGRQIDGDRIDVDGIVAEHADRLAGGTPEGRVYARDGSRRRDVCVLLLVDASGSTDAWVSGRERVIDVARQACLALGTALSALGDRYAIHAFSGRGAGDVRVQVAKRFDERFNERVRGRIGMLQPDRATRLGGPIRHATAQLARQPAGVRVLLVLSDGKPADDDLYEGEYGLADVRQAVFEARRAGVRPYCVTIDRTGPSYLPRLFGPAGYAVLWDVAQLPERLPALYRRIAVG